MSTKKDQNQEAVEKAKLRELAWRSARFNTNIIDKESYVYAVLDGKIGIDEAKLKESMADKLATIPHHEPCGEYFHVFGVITQPNAKEGHCHVCGRQMETETTPVTYQFVASVFKEV